jgi:SAM-dependent methyltransferase
MNPFNRLALFASQIIFSIITPPLLIPGIANLRFTRSFIAFCFGRSYGNRYQNIIDSFQGRYDLAMAEGLRKAKEIAGDNISIVADCGTGTGYVTRQAAKIFPHATFIAFDILPGMLKQARENCKDISTDVFYVRADSFALPLADESVDLLLAQNTMPCFSEFARVCRPGGMIIYVDSSAGWITSMAKRLIEKQQLFGRVLGEKVDLGFCILAQKRDDSQDRKNKILIKGNTKDERLYNQLRCSLDKSTVALDGESVCCEYNLYIL